VAGQLPVKMVCSCSQKTQHLCEKRGLGLQEKNCLDIESFQKIEVLHEGKKHEFRIKTTHKEIYFLRNKAFPSVQYIKVS